MAEEIRANEPTDAAEWAAIERRRKRALALVAAAVVVALAGAGIAAAALIGRPGPETPKVIEPIPETSASVQATNGAVATSSVSATKTPDTTGAVSPGGATKTPVEKPKVPLVAYRRDGWICVAKPDGSKETRLLQAADGVFSLSPDAATLAAVSANTLTLVDVGSKKALAVGSATQDRPSWSPDSAWLVYTKNLSAGPQVRRVDRDGGNNVKLFDGLDPTVSPGGDMVAGRTATAPGVLVAWGASGAERYAVGGQVTDVAVDGGHLYFVRMADASAAATLHRMDLGGHNDTVLRDSATAARPVSYHDLCVSPDGAYLAFAEWGDDGYSRLYSLPAGKTSATALSIRRDDYPLCWGSDGRLYFIEGNALQGEATKLMAVGPDGLGRVTIVEGATR